MKKIIPSSGDILQIPLLFNLGFAYAKYIDIHKIFKANYPSLIKVYEYWTPDKNFALNMIEQSSYLLDTILVAGILPTIKNNLWTNIGNLPINQNDLTIPKFKTHEPVWNTEENAKKWFIVEGFDISNKVEAAFEQVKHLDTIGAEGTGNIETIISMRILIKENIPIDKYFDLSNEGYNYQYKRIINSISLK